MWNNVGMHAARVQHFLQRATDYFEGMRLIAAVNLNTNGLIALSGVPGPMAEDSFSSDGMRRIGFLSINQSSEGELQATAVLKPERFRVKIAKLADDYVQQHSADWEIRA